MNTIILAFAQCMPYCFIMGIVSVLWNMVLNAFRGGY